MIAKPHTITRTRRKSLVIIPAFRLAFVFDLISSLAHDATTIRECPLKKESLAIGVSVVLYPLTQDELKIQVVKQISASLVRTSAYSLQVPQRGNL
jgi:hypothetical protein